jgi:hypothetical protein
MSGRLRGLQEIRTHSAVLGGSAQTNERHVLQFQLAALELERTRRNREKQAALRRVGDIDRTLSEIEKVMRQHQTALGLRDVETSAPGAGPAVAKEGEGEAAGIRRRVLKY